MFLYSGLPNSNRQAVRSLYPSGRAWQGLENYRIYRRMTTCYWH